MLNSRGYVDACFTDGRYNDIFTIGQIIDDPNHEAWGRCGAVSGDVPGQGLEQGIITVVQGAGIQLVKL